MLQKLKIDVPSRNGTIRVGATIGIATSPADATDAETLMALADQLMYVGKKAGRNRVVTIDDLPSETKHNRPKRWWQFLGANSRRKRWA
jgi:predicted signal transduction protein with EAL and GGDEF domain